MSENCGHPYNKLDDNGELVCITCGAKPYGEKAAKKSANKAKEPDEDKSKKTSKSKSKKK